MPLVEEQVEHLARPDRSLLSPKEKVSLTSKVKADTNNINLIKDSGNTHCVAIEVNGITGAAGVIGVNR